MTTDSDQAPCARCGLHNIRHSVVILSRLQIAWHPWRPAAEPACRCDVALLDQAYRRTRERMIPHSGDWADPRGFWLDARGRYCACRHDNESHGMIGACRIIGLLGEFRNSQAAVDASEAWADATDLNWWKTDRGLPPAARAAARARRLPLRMWRRLFQREAD